MRTTFDNRTRRVLAGVFVITTMLMAWQGARPSSRGDDRGFVLSDLRVIGLTDDGRFVSLKARTPKRTRDIGYVNGLSGADSALIGIDFRVQDGKLHGVENGGGM